MSEADENPDDSGNGPPANADVVAGSTAMSPPPTTPPAPSKPKRHPFRRIASALLIFIGAVLAPLSVIALWTKTTVTDTDHFVTTMAPLASNPNVQVAVTNRITNKITSSLDVKGIVRSALPARAKGLAVPIENAFDGFVHATVAKVVASPAFEPIFAAALRAAHSNAVDLLTGTGNKSVALTGDEVTLNLSKLVSNVKDQLVSAGISGAERIPTNAVPAYNVPLLQVKGIQKAQAGFDLLNTVGFWMPVIVLLLLAGGVLLSRHRRPTIVRCAIYVAIGMIILLILLAGGRAYLLHEARAKGLNAAATGSAFDILLRFLRQSTKALLTVSVLVALAVFITGPGPRLTAIRHAVARLLARIGAWLERVGVLPRGLRDWVRRFRWVLYIAVIVLYFVLAVVWDWPTGLVLFLLALAALALLALIGIVRSRTDEDLAEITAGPGSGPAPPPSTTLGSGPAGVEPAGA